MQYLTHTLDDGLLRYMPLPNDFELPAHIEIWSDSADDPFTFIEFDHKRNVNLEGYAIVSDPSIVDDESYIAFELSHMMYEIFSRRERDDNLLYELLNT